ncbi:Major Facilitator Superfamily [Aspergillus sclerotialis]|uniref:Major Facilitator Superfamily n=1 Tax=Aspergillus sclerotialis TaxID=2070753 RepID=A0A3A2ZJ61_9EURO|nr:Major Facilitator Superfamily [Aspergillus sclerotialis]
MHLNVANDTSSHSIGLVPVQTGPSSVRGPGERDLKNDNRFSQETNPIEDVDGDISKGLKTIVVCCITYSTGITTFLAGVVTMALPVINADLRLPSNLQLWPVTIYSLTCGCTLLICGSIADVVGNRQTYLVACFLQCVFTVACGFAKTGTQMIVFRAFSGVAASFSLPSSVSLINEVFPPGQSRNIAFASMGGAQPIGFGIGLVLGGIITGSIGWKWGFFVAAISNAVMLVISAWYLPKNAQQSVKVWHRIAADIDWIGVILASVSLALLSYIIAAITGSPLSIKLPQNITLLILSFALMLAFVLWVGRQERLGRPALIPNTLWKHKAFSCICVNDFCIWAAFNAFEQYQNFFFQEVQDISPLGAALTLPTGADLWRAN